MNSSLSKLANYRKAIEEWSASGRKANGSPPPLPESYGLKSVAMKFMARKLLEEVK